MHAHNRQAGQGARAPAAPAGAHRKPAALRPARWQLLHPHPLPVSPRCQEACQLPMAPSLDESCFSRALAHPARFLPPRIHVTSPHSAARRARQGSRGGVTVPWGLCVRIPAEGPIRGSRPARAAASAPVWAAPGARRGRSTVGAWRQGGLTWRSACAQTRHTCRSRGGRRQRRRRRVGHGRTAATDGRAGLRRGAPRPNSWEAPPAFARAKTPTHAAPPHPIPPRPAPSSPTPPHSPTPLTGSCRPGRGRSPPSSRPSHQARASPRCSSARGAAPPR
jgi:hypothetical protein